MKKPLRIIIMSRMTKLDIKARNKIKVFTPHTKYSMIIATRVSYNTVILYEFSIPG